MSSAGRLPDILRRIAGAILLALAPSLLLGGLDPHLGHPPGTAETPIFAEASHAGQANHWEAADPLRASHCPDCLAPAQPLAPALATAGRAPRDTGDGALAGYRFDATDAGCGRARRSRAPPFS